MRMGMRLPEKDIKKRQEVLSLKNHLLSFSFLLVLGTKMPGIFFLCSDPYLPKWFFSVFVPKIEIYKEKIQSLLKELSISAGNETTCEYISQKLKWNKLSMYWSLFFYIC